MERSGAGYWKVEFSGANDVRELLDG